jgi:death-on-curing protein
MLESALGRPMNKYAYGEVDLADLAAAYAFEIACNHPFVDGNKRAALLALIVFLGLNGVEFDVPEPEAAVAIQSLAAGTLSEAELALWIRDRLSGIER